MIWRAYPMRTLRRKAAVILCFAITSVILFALALYDTVLDFAYEVRFGFKDLWKTACKEWNSDDER